MIGRLKGIVHEHDATGSVLIDVGGVGYQVTTPVGTLGRAERADNGQVVLYIHTHVRQENLDLFGFASATDREVFRRLLSVPNVGPRTAIGVLSVFSSDDLAEAVAAKDTRRLGKVPGVGKKTAERLVLELTEKLTNLIGTAGAASRGAAEGTKVRVLTALTTMGYKQAEAERALKTVGQGAETESVDALLRAALRELAP